MLVLREKRFTKFYHSKEWLKLRQYKLALTLCVNVVLLCSHHFDNPERREVLTDGWAVEINKSF